MSWWFRIPLWQRVIGSLLLGVAAGAIFGEHISGIKWIGDFFIRAIKMLVVPLIFFSLVSGVSAIGDVRKLGRVGGRAIALFLLTGIISVALGLTLASVIPPGSGLSFVPDQNSIMPSKDSPSASEMILALIPENPVAAMANADILPLIIFAILVGVAILMAGKAGEPVAIFVDSASAIMQKVTAIIMELTPFGVFALMAWTTGTFGFDALVPLAKVVGLNYLGCGIVILVVYPILVRGFAKLPLVDFYRGIADAQAVAFSTSSSSAALPITLQCTQRNLGVSRSISSFTVSLGATINMNGTAVYLGIVTLFGAQIYGVDLTTVDYFLIGITATLGAVGAAGIPGAGLIMMSLVFSTVGVPLETIALIAGVDRIMDMIRTATNVTGDAAVAVLVAKMIGELDVEEYKSAKDI